MTEADDWIEVRFSDIIRHPITGDMPPDSEIMEAVRRVAKNVDAPAYRVPALIESCRRVAKAEREQFER